MAVDPDPYRTLGLKRGATLDEVKRAYRRLAKINHPDAAGESALPRFLAIQAAYEQLAGPGAAANGRKPAAPRRSWDPAADATRRAYGGRAKNPPPGAKGQAGSAGPPGGAGAAAGGGPDAAGGTAGGWRRRPGSTGSGAATGRPGRRRTYQPRPDPGNPGGAGTPPAGGKTRPPNKATFGSTSYDGADVGPFEPDWGGASWYGTTSGTYWTLNPKEYADPRKHGPEYQARARRAARVRDTDPPTGDPAAVPDDEAFAGAGPAEAGETAAAGADPAATGADPAATAGSAGPTHTTSSWWDSTAGPAAAPAGTDPAPGAGSGSFTGQREPANNDGYGSTPGDVGRGPRTGEPPPPDLGRAAADIGHALTDDRFGGPRGRLARAAIGWLPIALGLGWLVGEMTGCGRFAATCDDAAVGPMLFLVQVLAFAVLLVVPAAGSIATVAALTLLAAAVVASLVLSATGGAADGDSRRAALGSILLVAWLIGLGIAVARRARVARSGASPVS